MITKLVYHQIQLIVYRWHLVKLARADQLAPRLECPDQAAILVTKCDTSNLNTGILTIFENCIQRFDFVLQAISNQVMQFLLISAILQPFLIVLILFI